MIQIPICKHLVFLLVFLKTSPSFCQDKPFTLDKLSLSLGGTYRSSIYDKEIDTFVFGFSRYYENTKGIGVNLGLRSVFNNGIFINLNSNIRYDYTHTVRNILTNEKISDVKELLFDPSIAIGKELNVSLDGKLYFFADINTINILKKVPYSNQYGSPSMYDISYTVVGLGAGYIQKNIFIEPKVYYIPKGNYPFSRFRDHTMLGLKIGYLINLCNLKK